MLSTWWWLNVGQKAFFFDMTACTGCRCCQVACKETHDLPVGVFFRQVTDFEGGVFPKLWAASLSMGCNHCNDPQCVANCPVAAQKKQAETGLVLQDINMCIGCKKCVFACPYGAPSYNPENDTVRKCDGCIVLTTAGFQPACVAACSTRALKFGDRQQYEEMARTSLLTSDLSCLPDSNITHPNVLILPKDEMLS